MAGASTLEQKTPGAPATKASGGSPLRNTVYCSGNWGGTEVTEAENGSGINGAAG
jgi:hypothetical protein